MHNSLLAALTEDRRQCPCGAVAERSNGLCRKCQARLAWRRKTTSTHLEATLRLAGHRPRKAARRLASEKPTRPAMSRGMEES